MEGTLGTERGEVYAEIGKDGRGRSCFSNSSTGFLNIQLDPAIVMDKEYPVSYRPLLWSVSPPSRPW